MCKTGLSSSQAIIKFIIKNLRHVVRQNPSSGLRFKRENIAYTTHFNQIVTCTNAMKPSWKSCLHTAMRDKSLFGLPVFNSLAIHFGYMIGRV